MTLDGFSRTPDFCRGRWLDRFRGPLGRSRATRRCRDREGADVVEVFKVLMSGMLATGYDKVTDWREVSVLRRHATRRRGRR